MCGVEGFSPIVPARLVLPSTLSHSPANDEHNTPKCNMDMRSPHSDDDKDHKKL